MLNNPLWLLFIIAITINAFLMMNISVDHEDDTKLAGKGLAISTIVVLFISVAVGILTALSDESSTAVDGLLIGGILFVCGFFTSLFIFGLRKNRE